MNKISVSLLEEIRSVGDYTDQEKIRELKRRIEILNTFDPYVKEIIKEARKKKII